LEEFLNDAAIAVERRSPAFVHRVGTIEQSLPLREPGITQRLRLGVEVTNRDVCVDSLADRAREGLVPLWVWKARALPGVQVLRRRVPFSGREGQSDVVHLVVP